MHGRIDQRGHFQLVVQLLGCGRAPHRIVRAADLRGVAEVEDRQAVPRLWHLAAAALPHRPDVLLEGVEVAQRRRPQDRRSEAEIGRREHGVVVVDVAAGLEGIDELGQGLDPVPRGQVIVEGRDRGTE